MAANTDGLHFHLKTQRTQILQEQCRVPSQPVLDSMGITSTGLMDKLCQKID